MAKSPLKPEKPKPISIVSVRRTRKSIKIAWQQGDSSFDLDERDNPLPSFINAFDAVTPLVATICHFPSEYIAQGMRVVGLKMGEQGGAETVSLIARKDLSDASKEFAFVTPERLLQHPTQEGKYTPPLTPEEAELVHELIEQAKLYVRGKRAQGQIEFDGDDESEDGSGTHEPDQGAELPLGEGAAPDGDDESEDGKGSTGKPTRKKRGAVLGSKKN